MRGNRADGNKWERIEEWGEREEREWKERGREARGENGAGTLRRDGGPGRVLTVRLPTRMDELARVGQGSERREQSSQSSKGAADEGGRRARAVPASGPAAASSCGTGKWHHCTAASESSFVAGERAIAQARLEQSALDAASGQWCVGWCQLGDSSVQWWGSPARGALTFLGVDRTNQRPAVAGFRKWSLRSPGCP